ncbi:MAG TPA: type VI secretion system-associated FHA domain protein [Acidobacteriota bacterium]|nr:type VI secretion system-associated FHA domain protein [Acidobacteriota bacterium]
MNDEIERLRAENARLREQLELNRTAYDYLVRLAHHFSGEEEVAFDSPEQIRAFCERIKRSVGILVREFKELLSGRKKIQRDWSLYTSTAPAGGVSEGTAFIRSGDIHGDLGRYLFDWKSETVNDQVSRSLMDAIDELKHHQLALMAGYERCVREGCLAVLEEVAPEAVDAELAGGAASESAQSWRRWLPWRPFVLWGRFRERYGSITGEDDRWFQARFLPYFRQGYKEYMWAKKEAESAGEKPPSGKEGSPPEANG